MPAGASQDQRPRAPSVLCGTQDLKGMSGPWVGAGAGAPEARACQQGS